MGLYQRMKESLVLVHKNAIQGYRVYGYRLDNCDLVEEHWEEFLLLLNSGRVKIGVIDGNVAILLGEFEVKLIAYGPDDVPYKDEINTLLLRYPPDTRREIRIAFDCFRESTRGFFTVNEFVSILLLWCDYPIEAVCSGVKKYISIQDHKGKDDRYCNGIIKNETNRIATLAPVEVVSVCSSFDLMGEFRKRGGYDLPEEEASLLFLTLKESMLK